MRALRSPAARRRAEANLPPICTSSELGAALGKDRTTVYRLTCAGAIPRSCFVKIGTGKQVRYLTAKLRSAGILPAEVASA